MCQAWAHSTAESAKDRQTEVSPTFSTSIQRTSNGRTVLSKCRRSSNVLLSTNCRLICRRSVRASCRSRIFLHNAWASWVPYRSSCHRTHSSRLPRKRRRKARRNDFSNSYVFIIICFLVSLNIDWSTVCKKDLLWLSQQRHMLGLQLPLNLLETITNNHIIDSLFTKLNWLWIA